MPTPAPEHKDLVNRCLKNDQAAQLTLYRLFSARMLGVCERYTASEAEAEDVLQEAFLRVFTKLVDFRNEGELEGWVYRIVVTTALNHYKREKANRQLHALEEYTTDLTDSEASALDELSTDEVIMLLKKLPDGCRIVLNLFAIEGYSHAEISQLLGIQESTSKSQVCKARKMLVRLIEEQEKSMRHARY